VDSSGVISTLPPPSSPIPPPPAAPPGGRSNSRFGDLDLEASATRRRPCSLAAMNSRASASDCGPIEIVRLRRRREEIKLGISEGWGKSLSSLEGRGGIEVYSLCYFVR
jgi:hypothetical protein